MNRKYNLKLDLQFRCNNSTMKFNQFDNNTSDFFIKISNGGKSFDVEKAIVVLATIKPSGKVSSQFIEVKNDVIYADLKHNMKDEIGTYTAKAMLILEDERVVTDAISYEVEEDKIFSLLNDSAEASEEFTLLTDMLSKLSAIETSEEQRVINEAERILSEENRKIEEAKRVEAELIRQHEEADRAKYDATRESNENVRKQNESIRLANETNRIDEEAKRVEEETKRVEAEQLRKDNYNFMTEDEERRRLEANAHKEAEALRVQAETNRVNEEAKRRTIEQARVSAENTRVNNENTRETNELSRKNNEAKRVEAETQRQNRYNSFIADAEANANNFENYTNTAKVKEEERKSNELDRKSQEARRVSNEVERISNENTRKANEVAREKNETSRQNIFENKVNEVDKKIIEINATKDDFISSINTKVDTKISELNTTKDNFVSNINTKVDNKISELDNAKSDMTTTVSNKVNEVETRFNALTSSQQQDAEVIDARDGETSLKARLDRDIEKAKQIYVNVEGSNISTDSSSGYLKDVEILGNTIQDASNLADIRSVGDTVEGQELYEIPVVSCGKNLVNPNTYKKGRVTNTGVDATSVDWVYTSINVSKFNFITVSNLKWVSEGIICKKLNSVESLFLGNKVVNKDFETIDVRGYDEFVFSVKKSAVVDDRYIQIEEGTVATPYEPYIEDKLTILSPVQLEKVGDVRDRIICKDGVWGVEKNTIRKSLTASSVAHNGTVNGLTEYIIDTLENSDTTITSNVICNKLVNKFSTTEEGCFVTKNQFRVRVLTNTYPNTESIKNEVINNKWYIIYKSAQPQFIPLPHDQQIKLRTFANKTNISFLTEIEGTIKAQVPKSLGATVNTHTEQINNLNNELNRVKKLEESTVSTVTTESDFTTVEATSNGYFEDLKLEGKTLVNLSQSTVIGLGTSDLIETRVTPGKPHTIVVFGKYVGHLNFLGFADSSHLENKFFSVNGYTVIFDTFSYNDSTINNVKFRKHNIITDGEVKILILEGDHTQNPPSYFEGLKSVGQSASEDGADEIVVSSVNENLFDINEYRKKENWTGSTLYKAFKIQLKPNTKYTFNRYDSCGNGLNIYVNISDIANSSDTKTPIWVCHSTASAYTNKSKEFITNETGIVYINTYLAPNSNDSDLFEKVFKEFSIYEGTTAKPYTPHKQDKKRLLYYNNETQAWEKPILRQWDSIEKHANGKYYYHQRSGEVVLNGSENWNLNTQTQSESVIRFNLDATSIGMAGNRNPVISDKFRLTTNYDITSNEESIFTSMGGATLFITISKPKLSTQDVEGFKQWLQANNVTVVYQLAEEKVYECTNIDLVTYANETNFIVNSGAIVPRTTLKVHNNISNVVSLLQKKVSLLESDITSYMITQNRLMLASRYNADTVSFKVDVASFSDTFEYDNDLYELILNNILVGKDNYNREYIENLIIFYWMDFIISDEMYSTLFEIIEEQHNPKIEEETPLI